MEKDGGLGIFSDDGLRVAWARMVRKVSFWEPCLAFIGGENG